MILQAPGQAVLGGDLTITLGVAASADLRSVQADILYDPAVFEVAAAPGGTGASSAIMSREPGRVTVRSQNPNERGAPPTASVQLRAIAKQPISTQLVTTGVLIEDFSGRTSAGAAPPPRTINMVPK